MEEEKVQGETSGPGLGHTIPYEFSALCFSLSHKIPIISFPYWALFVKCIKGTQQILQRTLSVTTIVALWLLVLIISMYVTLPAITFER